MPDRKLYEESLELHAKSKGKLEIRSKIPLRSRRELSLIYTPGVGEVSRRIAKDPMLAYKYTIKSNAVAVVSDGSAVLGLGNVGGYAAIPVMEGKAVLFKELAGIDAFPIIFKDYHTDMIEDIRNIEPVFGAINLEDIAAPRCFEVEEALQGIGIPVMHDDQWGTAVVVLAALINAMKVVGKGLRECRIVISGAGAAGIAVSKLLLMHQPGIQEIILCDSKGIISSGREGLNKYKEEIAKVTNKKKINGQLKDAMLGADVFIGVSVAGIVTREMVKSMASDQIVLAMANPVPEIMPDEAKKAGAAIVGTGRADFPNQINNALAFPGIFRGALDSHAHEINFEMKLAAAKALAESVKKPTPECIVPEPLDREVPYAIAKAVADAARKSGCARSV
jgi:malate dehydrogenase (oxaloacetate-decarboxylating)